MSPVRSDSPSSTFSKQLGQPLTFPFSGKQVQNRFAKAAMSERLSSWDPNDRSKCGIPSTGLIQLYSRWGKEGEIGMLTTGSISVDSGYMEGAGNSIIPREEKDGPVKEERFQRFSQLASATKVNGSLIVGQINHQGRQAQAALQESPVSASDVQLMENELYMKYNKPHPATEEELADIIDAFRHGAQYLESAGFDGVQVNAAHGYIFSQFLSLSTNKRTDRWGGSIENRARLLLEVVRTIRANCAPTLLLSVKLNAFELEEDGISVEDVKQVCLLLEQEKVDVIELSGGTYKEWAWKHVRPGTSEGEGFFLPEAAQIKPILKTTKLYSTGGFKSAQAMAGALDVLDGVGLARPLCQDPTLCADILHRGSLGARKQHLDQNQYGFTALLAGNQMLSMSRGGNPVDGGKAETSGLLFSSLEAFMAERSVAPFGDKYGHIDLPVQ